MRRFLAPSSGLDKFFAAQFSAGYITNMSGFDLRQAQHIGLSRLRRIVVIVNAIGVWFARSHVLTICVHVELCAIAGLFDVGLRQNVSGKSGRGNSGGADQIEFHIGLLTR
jgi:hypothetical protein